MFHGIAHKTITVGRVSEEDPEGGPERWVTYLTLSSAAHSTIEDNRTTTAAVRGMRDLRGMLAEAAPAQAQSQATAAAAAADVEEEDE